MENTTLRNRHRGIPDGPEETDIYESPPNPRDIDFRSFEASVFWRFSPFGGSILRFGDRGFTYPTLQLEQPPQGVEQAVGGALFGFVAQRFKRRMQQLVHQAAD